VSMLLQGKRASSDQALIKPGRFLRLRALAEPRSLSLYILSSMTTLPDNSKRNDTRRMAHKSLYFIISKENARKNLPRTD